MRGDPAGKAANQLFVTIMRVHTLRIGWLGWPAIGLRR